MSIIDPANSTSPAFNRKTFVGISAAGAAVAASLGAGSAQTLGQTHPPLVAEDDPSIVASHIKLERDKPIDAYLAAPKGAGPATPGIVVCMHIWGVDTQIRDFARRLAKAGYATIVPNLYDRWDPPKGDGAADYQQFVPFAQKLNDAVVDGDLRAGAQYLRAAHPQGKVGTVGFCMGGSIALRQAIDNGDIFSAAAVFYGKVRYPMSSSDAQLAGAPTTMELGYADEVKIPMMGSWGARDTSIPSGDIPVLAQRLRVPNDLVVYEQAGHGFFDDQRPSYVATAADDAWKRLMNFFAKYLRP